MRAQVPEKATPITQMPTEIVLPLAQTSPEPAARVGPQPAQPATYYNRPMIKKPTWKWPIPLYFFLGGVAGGAAVIGAAAEILGGEKHKSTVRHARWLALVLGAICPIALIVDLGRPTRFYRMLRIFKVTSPLNVGTWILSTFGLLSGILGAKQAAEDDMIIRRESGLGRFLRAVPSKPFTALHGLVGLGLGGYTGVVLTATAVPLWAAAGILLGPLFLATSLASGAAALTLIGIFRGTGNKAAETPSLADQLRVDAARRQVEAVETAATVAQLGILAAREALVPARINKPLRRGLWGAVWQAGAVGGGVAVPLALRLAIRLSGRRTSETIAAVSATLSL
ncbi:MAG TPA: NrfD/PsrC family molybdoenzyme membrane anchor subunit, partial [Ktedonobacterales bacterium]|nr:NrfD/PsrC family molybdoenzyme membrane anchor subunit [Ktedonobacterales bacterium]